MKKSTGYSKIVVDETNKKGESPVLNYDDIKVEFESQGFRCSHIGFSPKKDKSVMFMESTASTESIHCPYCRKNVLMIENVHITLKDMMIWHGIEQNTFINLHRYQCTGCMKTFTETIPFKYPGTPHIEQQTG